MPASNGLLLVLLLLLLMLMLLSTASRRLKYRLQSRYLPYSATNSALIYALNQKWETRSFLIQSLNGRRDHFVAQNVGAKCAPAPHTVCSSCWFCTWCRDDESMSRILLWFHSFSPFVSYFLPLFHVSVSYADGRSSRSFTTGNQCVTLDLMWR